MSRRPLEDLFPRTRYRAHGGDVSAAVRSALRRARATVGFVLRRVLAGAADEPMMALFVGVLVLLAVGFLVAGVVVVAGLL